VTLLFESILRRDRWIVAAALVLVSLLAWAWLLSGAGMGMDAFEMTRHSLMSMDMMDAPVWTPGYIVLMFFMWWIMMVAMMTSLFAAGYLLAWAGFSTIAVAAQWWMQQNGWLNNMLVGQSQVINGILLLAAGLWQFSPWKHACLNHCKSPVEFLTTQRREGKSGALQMGLTHGGYCLGCCWFLMALLFVGGVMNLYWIIGLTIYVWIEKILPGGVLISRLMGVFLAIWGLGLLTGQI